MKKVGKEELKSMQGGHWHWICRDWLNFTSAKYSTATAAGAAAQAHVDKYPAHANDVSTYYCEKSSCK